MLQNSQITIRMSQELRLQLELEAAKLGVELSKLMRTKLAGKRIRKPKILVDSNIPLTFKQLSKAKIVYEDVIL